MSFVNVALIRTKSFVRQVRPRRDGAALGLSSTSLVPDRDAGRLGAHYSGEPRLLRARYASTLRHREATAALRVALARVAPGARRCGLTDIPALPLAHDAEPATTTHVASLARAAHGHARALRPRAFGCRAFVRRERRQGRHRRLSSFRSDRRSVHGERHLGCAPTRLHFAPSRDAARRWPDECGGHFARVDPRAQRAGTRSRSLLRRRAMGPRPR